MIYTSLMPDIKHPEHKHRKSSHKMIRIYSREKVKEKYEFVSVGWMCTDCGYFLMEAFSSNELIDE